MNIFPVIKCHKVSIWQPVHLVDAEPWITTASGPGLKVPHALYGPQRMREINETLI